MMMNQTTTSKFAFFGTPDLSVIVLEELERAGFTPALIITAPDAPQGRGMVMTPPPVKIWAEAHGIPVQQPIKITPEFIESLDPQAGWDVFIVVAYGKILPQALLDIPRRGTLNVHPSLLPRFRGPSPVRAAILADERETGVTVMQLDKLMDHGPIIAQKKMTHPPAGGWPAPAELLEKSLMQEGGTLLAQILPLWLAGEIEAQEQNHDVATYCEKITKEDGLLDLNADAYHNLLKIRAYDGWPGTYAFFERAGKSASRRIRVAILDAHIDNGALVIDTVKPEGKKEMSYQDFERSGVTLAN